MNLTPKNGLFAFRGRAAESEKAAPAGILSILHAEALTAKANPIRRVVNMLEAISTRPAEGFGVMLGRGGSPPAQIELAPV